MRASYIPEVDGLRAVAVLAVVLFHAGVSGFDGGFVGVDVFFTISGFVITRSISPDISSGEFSLGRFYVKRVRRLFPALLFTVAVTLLFAQQLMPPPLLEDTAQAAIYSIVPLSNIYFWISADYFDLGADVKPFLHSWSLSVEEQFYFVWPILIVVIAALGSKARSVSVILALSIVSLLAAQYMVGRDASAAFYLTPFRFFEFGLGGICAYYFDDLRRRQSSLLREGGFLFGITLIILAVVAFDSDTPFPGVTALLPTAGAALVILFSATKSAEFLLGNKPAVAIGRASYSIYLAHWPIITLYGLYSATAFNSFEIAAIVLASLACGFAMERWVEAPFRLSSRSSAADSAPFILGSAVVALAVVAVSANLWVSALKKAQTSASVDFDKLGFTETIDRVCREGEDPKFAGYNCELGIEKSAYDFVVFGDSHTGQLIPGLDTFARQNGLAIRVDGSGGLFPGIGVEIFRGTEHQASKARFVKKYYDWVADLEPTTVVLAARWAVYYDATRPPDEDGAPLMYLVGANDDEKSPEITTRAFEESMRQTVQYLRSLGHQVILVGQVPPLGRTPHLCLQRNGITSEAEDDNGCRDFTREEALSRTSKSNQFVSELAHGDGVRYIDPSSFFCQEGEKYCRIFDGRRLLYRDGNHISASASVDMVEEALAGYLE